MKYLKKIIEKIGLYYFYRIINGYFLAKRLIENKKWNYYLFSFGIGDVVWALSFIGEYLKKNNVSEYRIICLKRDDNVIGMYLSEEKTIVLDKKQLIYLETYCKSKLNIHSNLFHLVYPHVKTKKDAIYNSKILSDLGLEMDVLYKYGCMNLPYHAKIQFPNNLKYKQEAIEIIKKSDIVSGKFVLLIPYVNTRLKLPDFFWENIAKSFQTKGYDVYTNVSGNQKPIKETKSLSCSLEVIPSVINLAGRAISCRCGLCDWLFLNKCNLTVIHSYDSTKNETQSLYAQKESFSEMAHRCGIGSSIVEVRCDISHIEESYNNIKEVLFNE